MVTFRLAATSNSVSQLNQSHRSTDELRCDIQVLEQGGSLIYINQDQLKQLESLLSQSTMGIHLLFERPRIAAILKNPTEAQEFFSFENLNRVQSILGEFLQKASFEEKQRYLTDLDDQSYEILVRSYFNIVENTILEATKDKH
jgi:hypothetical protein